MFRRSLLPLVRPRPADEPGLVYDEGVEENGVILSGRTRLPATGETYPVKNGYLDLLKGSLGGSNVANLTNFLPGAGRGYEPLWRVRSLNLLTGEDFPNERELGIIAEKAGLDRGGLYLDLGCSAGLYTRNLARALGDSGDVVGLDISPSMLKEAARRARNSGVSPSFVRADAASLPFADACMTGAVCGGTLNELGDPARVLRETRRALEPGGRLAVMGILKATTPNGRRLQRFLSTGGIQFFDPEELTELLDTAGFEPDPLETHGAVFFAAATRR
ncbi:methyltransferase domain-containing protein [Rubrobacter tropicus]|uniref:Methyltransferase domain-containing protein n=1 Tax=Rubrobacter tropicus TaxID=2653851 RepID=A0A6G8Q7H5_9ACTN|nr:methyltransferase domain-containing protein [Rubrobacter tropicus]QIN82425.1 methyltransferase domain-containing protein [Rubrobacter tropicus]